MFTVEVNKYAHAGSSFTQEIHRGELLIEAHDIADKARSNGYRFAYVLLWKDGTSKVVYVSHVGYGVMKRLALSRPL